jgi:hypothetical protein
LALAHLAQGNYCFPPVRPGFAFVRFPRDHGKTKLPNSLRDSPCRVRNLLMSAPEKRAVLASSSDITGT